MTHHEGKLSQLLRTLCNAEELRKQELLTEQIKSIVRKLQQIKGEGKTSSEKVASCRRVGH